MKLKIQILHFWASFTLGVIVRPNSVQWNLRGKFPGIKREMSEINLFLSPFLLLDIIDFCCCCSHLVTLKEHMSLIHWGWQRRKKGRIWAHQTAWNLTLEPLTSVLQSSLPLYMEGLSSNCGQRGGVRLVYISGIAKRGVTAVVVGM